jgi:hypothetical protein
METKITKILDRGGYEQIIKYIKETKEIYFIDCTCGDFSGVYRPKEVVKGKVIREASWFPGERLKNSGEFSDKKFYAEPCKHLLPDIKVMEMQGGKLKRPKTMEGTDKCTAELRKIIMKRSGGMCEFPVWDGVCTNHGVEVHRKVPRTNGGKYNKDNCILLCEEHHKLVTYQKWHGTPGAKK